MIRIIPNKNNIGAEIDTDLQKLSKENFKIIINALNKYGMIFLEDKIFPLNIMLSLLKNFGKLADYPRLKRIKQKISSDNCCSKKRKR